MGVHLNGHYRIIEVKGEGQGEGEGELKDEIGVHPSIRLLPELRIQLRLFCNGDSKTGSG